MSKSLLLQQENLRSYVLGRMKTLTTLDDSAVSQEEISEAVKNVVSSHLTLATLLSCAHANDAPLPSLSVVPIAQTCTLNTPHHTPSALGTEWYDKVCVCVFL